MEELMLTEELKESQILAVKSSTWLVASMILETWAECIKRKIEHYYKLHREKYKFASNKKNPYS